MFRYTRAPHLFTFIYLFTFYLFTFIYFLIQGRRACEGEMRVRDIVDARMNAKPSPDEIRFNITLSYSLQVTILPLTQVLHIPYIIIITDLLSHSLIFLRELAP